MKQKRAPTPIIPGNADDRTGTAGILRRCNAEIRRRFVGLQRDVNALFNAIPILTSNDVQAEAIRTIYQMTPDQLARLSAELQAALERWIADGKDPANLFWFSAYEGEAQQLGTAQAVTNLTRLSTAYAATRTLQEVLYSEPYRTRLAAAQLRSQDWWTGLGATARGELSGIIGRAIVDGKNPRAVRTEIADRLQVSMSRAALYAQTEIPGSLRDARMAESEQAEKILGQKVRLLWTSALKPTTRPWHASRHGRTYTAGQVKEFYSVNGNRFRCFCSITETLVSADGRPVISETARAGLAKEKATWYAKNPPKS